jgi:hypothetical protein
MTLLLRDTETKTAEAPAPEGAAPGGEAPEAAAPVATACPKCGAPVESGQDWCLNCGEAQASRRIALPGKRAIGTVLALTGVLVIGAVAAAYAAIDHKSPVAPAGTTQVAQVPAPAPSAAAPAPAPVVPSDAAPSSTLPPTAGSTDVPPASSTPAPSIPDSTPAPSVPTSTPSTPTTGSTGTRSTSSTRDDTTSTTRTSTTPELPDPVAIRLDSSAAALYDPYRRDIADPASADPKKALDGEAGTSFPITVADGAESIGAGLVIDLGSKQGVREVDVTTKTPGFKIELYATDETDLPPDITDTRWAHLKDIRDVGTDTDGKVKVDLGAGTTKYRHVLLWLTTPPTDGFTARLSEVRVLG